MIFETTVEKLIGVIEHTERITTRNSSLPILNNILVLVSGKVMKVRATNLSLGVEFEIQVKSDADGVVVVDGKIISQFLNTLPKSEKIKVSIKDTTMTLVAGSSRTTVKTLPYEDFPTIPSVSGTEIVLPKGEFIRGIKSTCFASAVSDVKPEIASVYLMSEKNTLTFAATDSFRLAEKKEILKKNIDFPAILIPSKNITEISRVMESTNDEIRLIINENQIAVITTGIYMTSRLVSGSFPDYKQIIPKEFGTEVIILKQDLVNLLKAANIFSDKFNQITFNVNPSRKMFECFAKNSDIGEYDGSLTATLSGDDVSISINQKYLMDCLNIIPHDSIFLGLNGSNRAVVVRGSSDSSFTYLLMPMNR